MKKEDPSRTAMAISMPSRSPPCAADKDANTSGAPPPKARSVTPAKDSDSLNVFDICCKEGDRNSSAVKLSRKKAIPSAINYKTKNDVLVNEQEIIIILKTVLMIQRIQCMQDV